MLLESPLTIAVLICEVGLKRLFRYLLIVIVTLCLLSITSCLTEDDCNKDKDYDYYIALGKGFLTLGEGDNAREAFENALRFKENSTDARFGIVMAGAVNIFNFIDQIYGTIDALSFASAPDKKGEVDDSEGPVSFMETEDIPKFESPIHTYLYEYIGLQTQAAQKSYQDLLDEPDLTFELDFFPFYLGESELLSFSGPFDKTDLYFFGAMVSLIDGLYHFLMAHDLRFDFTAVILPDTGPDTSTFELIAGIVDLIENLLTSEQFPTFLYLEPENGVENMKDAGVDFGDAFFRLSESFSSLAAETTNQEGYGIRYFDTNHNGRFDLSADFVYAGQTIVLEPPMTRAIWDLSDSLSEAFYEGSPYDVNPYETEKLWLGDLTALLTGLGILPIELGPITIRTLPQNIGINIGGFFSDPEPDGLHSILMLVVNLFNILESGAFPMGTPDMVLPGRAPGNEDLYGSHQ